MDKGMLEEIDAVYEIADAELNSDKYFSDRGMSIIKRNPKPQAELAQLFLREIKKIAERDGLMAGAPEENFVSVANQVAKDWDDTKGFHYRLEKAVEVSAPGL
jgi:hypothetical protein